MSQKKEYTYMRLYKEIHHEVKILAALENISIIEMVRKLIESYKSLNK